jgi:hypothetical protein
MRLFPVVTVLTVTTLSATAGSVYLFWYGKNKCPETTQTYLQMAESGSSTVADEKAVNEEIISGL